MQNYNDNADPNLIRVYSSFKKKRENIPTSDWDFFMLGIKYAKGELDISPKKEVESIEDTVEGFYDSLNLK